MGIERLWSSGERLRTSLSDRIRRQLSGTPRGQLSVRLCAPLWDQVRIPLQGPLSDQLEEDWSQ